MTATCKKCGWEGDEDVLELRKCPKCGSRRITTDTGRLTHQKNRNPPKDAEKGE